MKPHRITEIGICCMRSDCRDHDCPGRELARLYQAEGGVQIDSGRTVRALVPSEPSPPYVRPWLQVALVAAALLYFITTVLN